jgi:EAL and modified HD-GYP domain-containing signal transduction protein
MSTSVLGSVTLGYEPIWNQWRHRSGVRLWVEANSNSCADARHLHAALAELWPHTKHPLLLSVRTPALLADLLEHAPSPGIWIEIQDEWLGDALLAGRVRQAQKRGLTMVWRGEPGQAPSAEVQGWFHQCLRSLTPQEALRALRVTLRQHQGLSGSAPAALPSPVVQGSLYEGLASPALVEHALDRQGASGVIGWPAEEVLHTYRFKQLQPARHLVLALVQAIDADESMETIEQRMGDEPLLNYRFLRFSNSASLGLQRDIGSVREGLMTLGYSRLRAWLMEQLPHASSDSNLDPIRASMVLRARIMERLADAGVEDELRREVFMCGIFSQVDLLLGEPLGAALLRLPLPGRVASAILGQTGPYAPWLEVATALESGSTRVIREVCKAHRMSSEEVNRALLRTLATTGIAARG